jgi:hypothetical protein
MDDDGSVQCQSQWIQLAGGLSVGIGLGILGGFLVLQSLSTISYSSGEKHVSSVSIPNHTSYNANNYRNHLLHWFHV